MWRTAAKALAAVVALLAMIVLGADLYLRRSLPIVEGTIQVGGIAAPIDIIRDADDVPHIFAATKLDALYGLGYVHAQDRLWQMEFQRRIGFGRLSEIFGGAALPEDRFLRTVGFGRAARAAWDRLSEDTRQQIDAYIAGVNAFIRAHHGSRLPPEFVLLRFEPEPWTGADVLVWVKMMAWDLSANYSFELMRHDLAARLGAERMADLLPPYPADGLNILTGAAMNAAPASNVARQEREQRRTGPADAFSIAGDFLGILSASRAEGIGSNNWVVDGTLTASGKPLLANDPHLATHIPSLWYLAHMKAGDFDVIGATLPGIPAVAIGRNRSIAWGETNVGADVEDLYLERVDASGRTSEFQGAQEPMHIVHETIKVKGDASVELDVRITRHGPLVSDALNANNADAKDEPKPALREPMAFRWTALDDDDQTITAFLHLNEARNWAGFTTALRDFSVPSQNFVYADIDGHIGYYAPGHIPIRAGGEGLMPADGWTGRAEWTGWIPFDELPHAYDPSTHFIVTANNRPMPVDYPHFIANEYPNPYRAKRITDLLQQQRRLTPDAFRDIQADTVSLHAQELLPILLQHAHPTGSADQAAVELLRKWDFDMRADSAAGAIFEAWFLDLAPTIAGDDLGDLALKSYRGRYSFVTRFIENTLASPSGARWCDDVRTPQPETCDDAVTKALHETVLTLTAQLGGEISRWRWDGVHRAVFPHQGLDSVGFLRPLLGRSVPNGGDWSTVDVGPVDADHPFDQTSIPGYRQIIDLSSNNDSRFQDAVGQSGHFLSSHYDDALRDWREVRERRMRMERADIERGAIGHLRLMPE